MNSFEDSGLKVELLNAVKELGFEKPTPIQARTIPHILSSGRDLIASAQTGTGKTAAFGLPSLQLTNIEDTRTQTLVLCPTRELCVQIVKDLTDYSKYIHGVGIVAVYGGAGMVPQVKALHKAAQIVVATPGRAKDLIKRKKLLLGQVVRVVLDEADEMLSMGFKEDLDAILAETPKNRQTLLFSATMSKEVTAITKKNMKDPVEISVSQKNTGADNVTHVYYSVQARDRYALIKRIADINPGIYGIVFCRTRREAKEVANKLIQDQYNADALHGDLSQAQRDEVMGRFRKRQLQLLVATDVAARGLDVNDLTHIINYSLPDDAEIYTHRSGRTGRAGKSGISIALILARDTRKLRDIEKMSGIRFTTAPVPSGRDICEKQLYTLIDKIINVEVDEKQIESFLPAIYDKLALLDREQLIKHFVSAEFNRFLAYYKHAKDPGNADSQKGSRGYDKDRRVSRDKGAGASGNRRERGERGDRRDREDRGDREQRGERGASRGRPDRESSPLTRMYINVGSKNGLNPARLMGLVNEGLDSGDAKIGKIEILKKFSFFEIDSSKAQPLMAALKGQAHDGQALQVEISEEKLHRPPTPRIKANRRTFPDRNQKSGFKERGQRVKSRKNFRKR